MSNSEYKVCTTIADAKLRDTKYWKNKPIVKITDKKTHGVKQIISDNEIKVKNLTILPQGYVWDCYDINNYCKMKNVCDFLTKNYKRGTDSEYYMKYDPDYIKWEMCLKGEFLVIYQDNNLDDIIACIGFTYKTAQIMDNIYDLCEPVYMCCADKYKGSGIAKVLMEEVTRRSVSVGITNGFICNNRIVNLPVSTIRQYSRPLNYKALREHDFVNIENVDEDHIHTLTRIKLKPNKKYKVASKTHQNIDLVYDLYERYMTTFNLHMVLTKTDIENYMFNDRYAKTVLVYTEENDNTPVDFITYNFYDIYRGGNNVIKAANILMYSSNVIRPDLLFINIFKQISYDGIYIVYINDIMQSNEAILSTAKFGDEDTDDEEKDAAYDMNMIRTSKKTFLSFYNLSCEPLKQNMVSWIMF